MSSSLRRQRRVAELLHQEIGNALQFEIRDPRIGFITVTGVEINADLTIATVYVSLLGDETSEAEALAGLESAKPFLKRLLGQKVKLRLMPELQFKVDRSLAYAQKIETLLSQLDIPPESDDKPDNNGENAP